MEDKNDDKKVFEGYVFHENGGYADFSYLYDTLMYDVDYKERAAYIAALFSKHKSIHKDMIKSVLDLACGSGNLSIELTKMGYDLICVDSSEEMLSIAQDKLHALDIESSSPLILLQDMRELDLYGTVEGAVSTMDSINHLLTFQDLDKTLSRLKFFIEPKGLFIFDLNTIYKHKNILGDNTFVNETKDIFMVWNNQYEKETHIVNMYLDFFVKYQDEKLYDRISEKVVERAYTVEQIETALKNNKFEIVEIYDDLTFNMPRDDSEKITVVARRI